MLLQCTAAHTNIIACKLVDESFVLVIHISIFQDTIAKPLKLTLTNTHFSNICICLQMHNQLKERIKMLMKRIH